MICHLSPIPDCILWHVQHLWEQRDTRIDAIAIVQRIIAQNFLGEDLESGEGKLLNMLTVGKKEFELFVRFVQIVLASPMRIIHVFVRTRYSETRCMRVSDGIGSQFYELRFDATEKPIWRPDESPTTSAMLVAIVSYQRMWARERKRLEAIAMGEKRVGVERLVVRTCRGENVGSSERKLVAKILQGRIEEAIEAIGGERVQETRNLYEAYKYLEDEDLSAEEDERGLMEAADFIPTLNRKLRTNLKESPSGTAPGKFSSALRKTVYGKKAYWYDQRSEEEMESQVDMVVNSHNRMYCKLSAVLRKASVPHKENWTLMTEVIYAMFKLAGWVFLSLVTLHPFADANGRTCRLLASRLLEQFTPFPTPIYNVYARAASDVYLMTIHACQVCESDSDRTLKMRNPPCDFVALIIESNYYAWRRFLCRLGNQVEKLGTYADI